MSYNLESISEALGERLSQLLCMHAWYYRQNWGHYHCHKCGKLSHHLPMKEDVIDPKYLWSWERNPEDFDTSSIQTAKGCE